jgi:two-component system copper resistance phosphate regulon response regulator CusR
MARVLVVEDDLELAESLADNLELDGYQTTFVVSGEEALKILQTEEFDVIVLDWGLPRQSGISILHQYRNQGGLTPVIFLTGRQDMDSKTSGLDVGADDYITKPFSWEEFASRLRAVLRRPKTVMKSITAGNLYVDLEKRLVSVDNKPVSLSSGEYAVLEFLLRHPNQSFKAEELLYRVWAMDAEASPDAVRTCVKTLRKKLGASGDSNIISTTGGGYRIDLEERANG